MKKLIIILLAIIGAWLPGLCYPLEVLLQWNSVSSANGYNVYYGSESGIYQTPIDVGNNQTNHTLTLDPGTYYFALTAYNDKGESGYSSEVNVTVGLSSYIDLSSIRIDWLDASHFNKTHFGDTGNSISLDWNDVFDISEYYVRVFDINRQENVIIATASSSDVNIVLPRTGAYKIRLSINGVDWVDVPHRFVGWIGQPGPVIIN